MRQKYPGSAITPRDDEQRQEYGQVLSPTLWRLFAVIWLPFLFYPLYAILSQHTAPERLIVTLVGAALLLSLYLWLTLPIPFQVQRQAHGGEYLALAFLGADALFLTLASSVDWLWFFMFVSIALGVRLSARQAAWAIMGLAVLVIVVGEQALGWVFAFRIALPVVVVGLGMIGVGLLVETIRELRAARLEIARLAVSEERLRFARDLHDLLGHSLSTITLKNELARSLISRQPDRAAQELEEAIGMARTALRDVREAVTGYRQPTLAEELRNAQEILAAAGIVGLIDDVNMLPTLPTALDTTLAWAVREGVTNVVRYSGAEHCTVRIARDAGVIVMTMTDDGHGNSDGATMEIPGRFGTGLQGLAERAAYLHGSVEARACADGGFFLRMALPQSDSEHVVKAVVKAYEKGDGDKEKKGI